MAPADVLLTNGYFLRVDLRADEGRPLQEDIHPDGKVERAYRSGRVQISYPTGTRKDVLPNGVQTVVFSNGDVKQTGVDKRVVYYYSEAATTHVSESNGTQLYHFPNGQVHTRGPAPSPRTRMARSSTVSRKQGATDTHTLARTAAASQLCARRLTGASWP